MANTTDKLKSGTSVLADTHTRLEETVNVGEGIMGELHRNRETMTRVRGNVGVVSGALDEARKLLRGMMKREARTRVALGIFAVVLVAVIIGMIGASGARARRRGLRAYTRARARSTARAFFPPSCSLARQPTEVILSWWPSPPLPRPTTRATFQTSFSRSIEPRRCRRASVS